MVEVTCPNCATRGRVPFVLETRFQGMTAEELNAAAVIRWGFDWLSEQERVIAVVQALRVNYRDEDARLLCMAMAWANLDHRDRTGARPPVTSPPAEGSEVAEHPADGMARALAGEQGPPAC